MEVLYEDLEEAVQQLGGVWTVACVEEKAPLKVATDLARKYSVCSVTQKTKKVNLEVAIESCPEES